MHQLCANVRGAQSIYALRLQINYAFKLWDTDYFQVFL